MSRLWQRLLGTSTLMADGGWLLAGVGAAVRRTGSAWTRAPCTAVSATLDPRQPPLGKPCSTHPLTMSSGPCCPSALPSEPHDPVAGSWTGVFQTFNDGHVAGRPYEALAERKAKKEKGLWRLAPGQAKL